MERRSGGDTMRGWVVPVAALVVAVGLITAAVNNRPEPQPSPSVRPSIERITPAPANDHSVQTDQGTVGFGVESGSLVIRLTKASGTHELARVEIVGSPSASGSAPPTSGASAFVMVCGTGSAERRYVFGRLDPGANPTLSGPPTLGGVAADGTFLFAIQPGSPDEEIRILEGTRARLSFRSTAFDALAEKGNRQPSGCFVSG